MSEIPLENTIEKIKTICDESGGRSQFFPWGGSGYKASVAHYYESSTELSHAAVQPGSAEDLQKIVKVIAETRVPFAVKCGGHNSNPGFSSTKGIQIFLARFNKITVREKEKLVDVGAGCLFGELYRALAPYNLNIVGGEGLAGIGVAGWLLGGGYSVKTNQYGLGIDNIESVKIVLPDGSSKEVGEKSEDQDSRDLFFAIRGGGNNFGIVTEFTLKAHDQAELYYDFTLTYKEEHYNTAKDAVGNFINSLTDNKASLKAVFRCQNTPDGIKKFLTVHCVYDGRLVVDPFRELAAIPHEDLTNNGSQYPPLAVDESAASTKTSAFYKADILRSWADETYDLSELPKELQDYETDEVRHGDLIRSTSRFLPARVTVKPMPGISQFPRGRWGCVMVNEFTPEVISIIEAEHEAAAAHINKYGGRRVNIILRPFIKTMFKNATDSAWPHKADQPNFPIIVQLTWEGQGKDDENDKFWVTTMKNTLKNLRDKIHRLSPSSRELPYFISASFAEDASVRDLYRDNLSRLGLLRRRYDPHGVMDLTGGFRIPSVILVHSESKHFNGEAR